MGTRLVSPVSKNEPPPTLDSDQLTRSTAELYAQLTPESLTNGAAKNSKGELQHLHYGAYIKQRQGLDWTYHLLPTRERQLLQDSIVSSVLSRSHSECNHPTESSHSTSKKRTSSTKPLALFTAGGMGAGKGHTLREMLKNGEIRLPQNFVYVDPDALARELPEREQYLRADAATASKKLHPEAALLQEILSEAARAQRRSLVIDGSLSDCAWFSTLMKRYGADGYDCEIVFVTAPEAKMLERAERRAKITGRVTNPEALKQSRQKSPQCVTNLSTPAHVRRVRLVDNASDDAPSQVIYDSDRDPRWKNDDDETGVDVKGFVDGKLEQGEDGIVREKERKAHM